MKPIIGVVGAGSWGTTLAKVLGENGRRTLLWTRQQELRRIINDTHANERYLPGVKLPRAVTATCDLAEIGESCTLILVVVPSHGFRDVVRAMGPHMKGDHLVVHCTKGFEPGSCCRMSEILREETCVRKLGVLSGPNLAREIAAGKPAGTLVASRFDEVVVAAQEALRCPTFRVYGGSDVAGAEVGGAFKNIIAIAAGAVDGLGLGDNTKSLLLTRSLTEMARVGAVMGADASTFWGLSGVGDLWATCASPLSRNHQVGERLAAGDSLEQITQSMVEVAEGVRTTRAVDEWADRLGIHLRIVRGVYDVLYEGLPLRDAIDALMRSPFDREFPIREIEAEVAPSAVSGGGRLGAREAAEVQRRVAPIGRPDGRVEVTVERAAAMPAVASVRAVGGGAPVAALPVAEAAARTTDDGRGQPGAPA